MHTQRWKQAWLFLSLDAVEPFHADLWVRSFGSELRREFGRVLEPWIKTEEYFTDFGRAHFHLAQWFLNRYGPDHFQRLANWVEYVFLLEGPDRVAETAWSVFVYKLVADQQATSGVSTEVIKCLTAARTEHEARKAELEKRIVGHLQQSPTSWDKSISELQDARPEDLSNLIRLTCDCNVFVEAWERHCHGLTVAELDQLDAIGGKLAEDGHMDRMAGGNAVLYPGIWRLELLPVMKHVDLQTG
jgi:hypothetical protein